MIAPGQRPVGRLGVLACALALGCGESGPGAPDGGGDPDGGIDVSSLEYRPCDDATRVGVFRIDLEAEFTGVQGEVFDGVVPLNVSEVVREEGECTLFTPPSLFCDPACVPGETCSETGECIPQPSRRDVGTVAIAGMEVPVEMTPRAPGNFYTNRGSLPHPGFAPGAGMELTATGGDYEPFSLLGWGVGELVATVDDVPVERDSPASVTWEAPDDPGPAMVHVRLDLNRHGGTATWAVCDVPDTGAFEFPASLVNFLLDDGLSGWPMVVLSRRTVDSTTIEPGCVEFRVQSEIELEVRIPDVDSCNDDGDCPEGETCGVDLLCS